jgi:hypothetical protein
MAPNRRKRKIRCCPGFCRYYEVHCVAILLKISGRPYFSIASRNASTQKSESIEIDTRHNKNRRLNQSIGRRSGSMCRKASAAPTATKYTNPGQSHFRKMPAAGVLRLGTVALDGTKIHANASRYSALSYEHATKIETQLKAEVADLLGKAEAADQAEVPDGMQVPEELARREKRLSEIPSSGYSNGFAIGTLASLARAKAVIEARAKERHARERAEYEAKMAAREAKAAETGKKPRGREPQPPVEGPLPADQMNLTDEESRIMPMAEGGFEQCYVVRRHASA